MTNRTGEWFDRARVSGAIAQEVIDVLAALNKRSEACDDGGVLK